LNIRTALVVVVVVVVVIQKFIPESNLNMLWCNSHEVYYVMLPEE